jgi:hypothetical protein
LEWGVAERESDGRALKTAVKAQQEIKLMPAVAVPSPALEKPGVAEAAPRKPGVAVQRVDESAPAL